MESLIIHNKINGDGAYWQSVILRKLCEVRDFIVRKIEKTENRVASIE